LVSNLSRARYKPSCMIGFRKTSGTSSADGGVQR
jgi:hypothetical protein